MPHCVHEGETNIFEGSMVLVGDEGGATYQPCLLYGPAVSCVVGRIPLLPVGLHKNTYGAIKPRQEAGLKVFTISQ